MVALEDLRRAGCDILTLGQYLQPTLKHLPVMEFVSSGEGLELSLAFMKIKDPKVRKRMLDLVKSLAEEEAGEG